MSAPLLAVRGLAKAWAGIPVLRDLDLTVEAGRHLLVTGPSGAGKSTLLALLSRLTLPDAGSIALRGQDIGRLGEPGRYRRENLGLVFQEVHLIDAMTVWQNLDMVRRATRHPGPEPAALLAPLGLAHRAGDRAGVLSRGEKQRVALARAFANGPALVLADEPTASLDPANRDRTLDHLFALCAASGATAVVVSHDPALGQRPELAATLRLGPEGLG